MPKNKSKKKGSGRGDKEKPLLTVQGILRLDKTFVTAQYADAEVIKVKLKEEEEAKEVKLIPGIIKFVIWKSEKKTSTSHSIWIHFFILNTYI